MSICFFLFHPVNIRFGLVSYTADTNLCAVAIYIVIHASGSVDQRRIGL